MSNYNKKLCQIIKQINIYINLNTYLHLIYENRMLQIFVSLVWKTVSHLLNNEYIIL